MVYFGLTLHQSALIVSDFHTLADLSRKEKFVCEKTGKNGRNLVQLQAILIYVYFLLDEWTCASGYTMLFEKCYAIFENSLNHVQAELFCGRNVTGSIALANTMFHVRIIFLYLHS